MNADVCHSKRCPLSNCDLANRKWTVQRHIIAPIRARRRYPQICSWWPLNINPNPNQGPAVVEGSCNPMTVTLHAAGEQSPDQFTETVENIQSSPPNTDSDGESENTDDSEGEIKKIVYTD